MNNLVTLCAVLATAVYFVNAYDFQDTDFNQLLSSDLEDAIDSLNDIPLRVGRSRRDEEAAMALDDKCRKRHRRPKLCCADDVFDKQHEKDKDLFRSCFKEITGADKHDHHHKKFDLFSCEEVEKRKNEMICVQECVGKKKNLLNDEGEPKREAVEKHLKESFAKEAWFDTVADKILTTCLAEAKNATEHQAKSSSDDIKLCNPAGTTLKHCLFKEIQLNCPAEQIKDKTACDKFQDRIKKGLDLFGPPPPPFDGPKDD